MKIVLDTNVLVSGLLKPYSHAATILRLVAGGLVLVVYDSRILTEYREVLYRPKFGLKKEDIEAILTQIESEGVLVTAQPLSVKLPDPDDEPFLEVALALNGTFIVTGNTKHFPVPSQLGVTVLTPAQFISARRD
jgi:putative PIN family toxin of toxin-antitoxin system